MTANIIEIFQSIQGEGKYAGVNQVFVRFFECNMHCHWCDTPHSIGDTTRRFREVTLEELTAEIKAAWPGSHSVTLTGGEPLLQAEALQALIPDLRAAGMPVHLETNGILPDGLAKVIDGVDVIAMDIKMPSSTRCRPYWDEHRKFLEVACRREVFVKTVITRDTDAEDLRHTIELIAAVDPGILFILQPNTFELGQGVMETCRQFYLTANQRLDNVRVLPQMHKMMKVR
ncbi:MAG: 7-carboxy-7-deazaguanine synthase QueE [Candidatus Omnitrophica bacterium]|nr:7-carboxy-7-deazaguanine synthase QueE [Candidatus Omnitrophota bacterium]MCB9719510.1 7-carboxy-7-deazaguanine synthase QueE [Candidatus Omnitrophota bacterium]